MAASDFDYIATRSRVIERAMRMVGAHSLGQVLSGAKMDQGVQAMQSMINLWQVDGAFFWTHKEFTVNLVIDQVEYALGSDPPVLGISSAMFVETDRERPLKVISRNDYAELTNKSDKDTPTEVALSFSKPATLLVNKKPTAVGVIKLWCAVKVKDLDLASNLADFFNLWEEALTYGLADALSDEYPLPVAEKDRLSVKAGGAYTTAKRFRPDRTEDEYVKPAF